MTSKRRKRTEYEKQKWSRKEPLASSERYFKNHWCDVSGRMSCLRLEIVEHFLLMILGARCGSRGSLRQELRIFTTITVINERQKEQTKESGAHRSCVCISQLHASYTLSHSRLTTTPKAAWSTPPPPTRTNKSCRSRQSFAFPHGWLCQATSNDQNGQTGTSRSYWMTSTSKVAIEHAAGPASG